MLEFLLHTEIKTEWNRIRVVIESKQVRSSISLHENMFNFQ